METITKNNKEYFLLLDSQLECEDCSLLNGLDECSVKEDRRCVDLGGVWKLKKQLKNI